MTQQIFTQQILKKTNDVIFERFSQGEKDQTVFICFGNSELNCIEP